MNYKVAQKMNEVFALDKNYNIVLGKVKLEDPLCKGYIYANLFFYDEVQKEIEKLRTMVKKTYDEVCMELGMDDSDPVKLLLEISTRMNRAIGSDGLDYIVKEFLAQKSSHLALMTDERERDKFQQICEAIFIELTDAFFQNSIKGAITDEKGQSKFKYTRAYVDLMTERQKLLVAPTLRVVGLENKVKLGNLKIGDDWSVTYVPSALSMGFDRQEEIIKEQIKDFIRKHS